MALHFSKCTFVSFLKLCVAIPWNAPRQTSYIGNALYDQDGWTPRPTIASIPKKPVFTMVDGKPNKRQDDVVTPGNCGTFNGVDLETTLSCGTASPSCATSNNLAGCCEASGICLVPSTCYDVYNMHQLTESTGDSGSFTGSKDAAAITCTYADANFACVTFFSNVAKYVQVTGYTCGTAATAISVFGELSDSSSSYPISSSPASGEIASAISSLLDLSSSDDSTGTNGGSIAAASTAPLDTSSSSSSDDSSGTSGGKIAGYVIAVIGTVAAIAARMIMNHHKRKKKAALEEKEKEKEKQATQSNKSDHQKPELPGGPQVHEADSTAVGEPSSYNVYNELEGSPKPVYQWYVPQEPDAPQVFHELPADMLPQQTHEYEEEKASTSHAVQKADRGFLSRLEKKLHPSKELGHDKKLS